MQKIIPFKKEMPFKSEVSEITSISLEHTLHKEKENLVTGMFTVSGDYKVVDTSNVIDHFSFEIPFDIHIDDKYNLEKVHIDIDDFYYEIINSKSLMINIDVLLDKLEEVEEVRKEEAIEELESLEEELEKEMQKVEKKDIWEEKEIVDRKEEIVDRKEEIVDRKEEIEDIEREEVYIETEKENIEPVSSIFDSFDQSVSASSIYKVYMVREEDSLESILAKYKISKEELEKYNHLKDMKKGDKLIIPTVESEKI